MTEQPVIVQKISWSDLCPWTVIFKTLPIASSVAVLAFALLGVVLTPAGWMLSENLLNAGDRTDSNLMKVAELNRSPYRGVFLSTNDEAKSIEVMGLHFSGPRNVFQQLVTPFQHLFTINLGMRKFLYLLLGAFVQFSFGHLSGLRSPESACLN